MDTIRNYLENMFAALPVTDEVIKAKNELGVMMEDKYTELLEEGKSENEAIGIVISEFGNLEEVSKELGLKSELKNSDKVIADKNITKITMKMAKDYIKEKKSSAMLVALGVMFCILAFIPAVIFDQIEIPRFDADAIGALGLFFMIGIGVICFIIAGSKMSKWKFIEKKQGIIEYQTASFVSEEKKKFDSVYLVERIVGGIMFLLFITSEIVLDAIDTTGSLTTASYMEMASGIVFFTFVALGVFFFVHAGIASNAYKNLLNVNDREVFAGNYDSIKDSHVRYKSSLIETIIDVYWPTVTCLYLINSFLTFSWGTTWLIWPLAAIVKFIIDKAFIVKE